MLLLWSKEKNPVGFYTSIHTKATHICSVNFSITNPFTKRLEKNKSKEIKKKFTRVYQVVVSIAYICVLLLVEVF